MVHDASNLAPSHEPEKHVSLYLDDGNIVLAARTEVGDPAVPARTVLFRVHKSVLKRQSSVFSDMLTLPEGTDGEAHTNSTMEGGVPIVSMPDSAEDIEALLEVLYDPLYVAILFLYEFKLTSTSSIQGAATEKQRPRHCRLCQTHSQDGDEVPAGRNSQENCL